MKELQERMDEMHMNPHQQDICRANLSMGMNEDEAFRRAMCSATTPEHERPVRTPYQEYPKMVYHPNPEEATAKDVFKVVKDAKEYAAAKKDGWEDKPNADHLEILQAGQKLVAAKPEAGEPALPKAKARKVVAA